MDPKQIEELNSQFAGSKPEEVLDYFLKEFEGKIGLSSSMSVEDQVLTHMCCQNETRPRIFTLDTGRMFQEVYDLIDKTSAKYQVDFEVFFPHPERVEKMVAERGINLFYKSIENRKLCCSIRKIEPLKRALSGLDIWICGMRAEQSVTRINNKLLEWDEGNGLLKLSPLINWTEAEVWEYVKKNNIPYNPMHDNGFPSIGCLPCTRAVKKGEDSRSGRWWWEEPESRECGLHNRPKN